MNRAKEVRSDVVSKTTGIEGQWARRDFGAKITLVVIGMLIDDRLASGITRP